MSDDNLLTITGGKRPGSSLSDSNDSGKRHRASTEDDVEILDGDQIRINESDIEDKKPQNSESLISESFLRHFQKGISKMTRKDLEELVLIKMIDAFVSSSGIKELSNKFNQQEQLNKVLWSKITDLTKQIRDMEMVHTRVAKDLQTRNQGVILPIKITRAVAMQVNLPMKKNLTKPSTPSSSSSTASSTISTTSSPSSTLPTSAISKPISNMVAKKSVSSLNRSPISILPLVPTSFSQVMATETSPVTIKELNTPTSSIVTTNSNMSITPCEQLMSSESAITKSSDVVTKKKSTIRISPMRPPLSESQQKALVQQNLQEQMNSLRAVQSNILPAGRRVIGQPSKPVQQKKQVYAHNNNGTILMSTTPPPLVSTHHNSPM